MIGRPKVRFLPDGKEGSGLLPWVIAVMMYLCALALGAGFGLDHAVEGWTLDLTDKVTVQIVQEDDTDRDRQVDLAVEALVATPGVVAAEPLPEDEIASLLEPWLGVGNVGNDLPIPAMIDVTLDAALAVDLSALEAQLRQVAPDARLDDHQQWIGDLLLVANSVEITAGLIVALIIFSTVAIVIFGTSGGSPPIRNALRSCI